MRPHLEDAQPEGAAVKGVPWREKRRLVLLAASFVALTGALFLAYDAARDGEVDERGKSDAHAEGEPLLDRSRLEALVHDARPEDRVVLESEAADLALAAARKQRVGERHTGPELDSALIAELTAHPGPARGRTFTARGRVAAVRLRAGAVGEDQYLGRLELVDGSTVYCLVLALPERAAAEHALVRIDGIFLKAFDTEDDLAPGTWRPGPLLVAARAEPIAPEAALAPTSALTSELEPSGWRPSRGVAIALGLVLGTLAVALSRRARRPLRRALEPATRRHPLRVVRDDDEARAGNVQDSDARASDARKGDRRDDGSTDDGRGTAAR